MKRCAQMVKLLRWCAAFFLLATCARAATHYVAITSTNPVSPFITWETAATNIQDAIDVSVSNDTVLVSNGVYATGGRVVYGAMTNRIAITNAITVRSLNGPESAIIEGSGPMGENAIRGAYVGTNAVLSGFLLTNGHTRSNSGGPSSDWNGGGAYCEASAILTNCVITGNHAASAGGGTYYGSLDNCALVGNAAVNGGGTYFSAINNSTLANNTAGYSGGGSYYGTLSNCILTGNTATGYGGGGAYQATLNNCVLCSNSSPSGGGAFLSALTSCTLDGNSATWGGGLYYGSMIGCLVTNNTAQYGGGAHGATLNDCVVSGNSARYFGGGVHGGTLSNCTLLGNAASSLGGAGSSAVFYKCRILQNRSSPFGGGVANCGLYNCVLTGNSAASGGASFRGQLNNCVISGNSASYMGGGAHGSTLFNCIAYFNTALIGSNYRSNEMFYCCTEPIPTNGFGNITSDPQFVDAANSNFHLLATSPCIDRGNNEYVQLEMDLDGNPRVMYGVVDMGAYEFQSPVGYWQWALSITNGQTNLTDSAAGDGYANLLKYATGSSPTNSDGLAAMGGEMTNGFFALRFNRNTNASDVTLVVEGSDAVTNDASWSGIATNFLGSWGGATNVVESGTGTPMVVSVQDTAPEATNRFLRLRVTRP